MSFNPNKLTKEQKDQFKSAWFKVPIPEFTLNVIAIIDDGIDLFDLSISTTMLGFIPKVNIKTISKSKEPIKSLEGVTIVPDYSFDDEFDVDVIVLAAGSGPTAESTQFLQKIQSKVSKFIFSVCQGSEVLAAAGLLDSKKATVTKGMFSMILKQYPKVNWIRQARFVHDGQFITSSGGAAGLDGIFYLISLIYGEQVATNVAKLNEYSWVKDPSHDPFSNVEDEFPLPKF